MYCHQRELLIETRTRQTVVGKSTFKRWLRELGFEHMHRGGVGYWVKGNIKVSATSKGRSRPVRYRSYVLLVHDSKRFFEISTKNTLTKTELYNKILFGK